MDITREDMARWYPGTQQLWDYMLEQGAKANVMSAKACRRALEAAPFADFSADRMYFSKRRRKGCFFIKCSWYGLEKWRLKPEYEVVKHDPWNTNRTLAQLGDDLRAAYGARVEDYALTTSLLADIGFTYSGTPRR